MSQITKQRQQLQLQLLGAGQIEFQTSHRHLHVDSARCFLVAPGPPRVRADVIRMMMLMMMMVGGGGACGGASRHLLQLSWILLLLLLLLNCNFCDQPLAVAATSLQRAERQHLAQVARQTGGLGACECVADTCRWSVCRWDGFNWIEDRIASIVWQVRLGGNCAI